MNIFDKDDDLCPRCDKKLTNGKRAWYDFICDDCGIEGVVDRDEDSGDVIKHYHWSKYNISWSFTNKKTISCMIFIKGKIIKELNENNFPITTNEDKILKILLIL